MKLQASAQARLARFLIAAVVALLAGATLVQGTIAGTRSTSASRQDTLILGAVGAPLNIDPVHADNLQNNLVDAALYDRLVTFNAKGTLQGSLAESFSQSKNATSVSITLRSGVRFHDGTPLTARDVAYTLDRIKNLNTGVAGLLTPYGSTKVTDNTHLRINLTTPSTLFLGALSKVWILNSKLVSANAGSDDGQTWLQSNDAGSGPYTFQALQGTDYGLALNSSYWGGATGRPPAMVVRLFGISTTEAAAVKSGDIDVALNLSNSDASALAGDHDLITAKIPQPSMTVIWMNNQTGPTANPTVRKALQMAYDYSGGLNSILNGNASIQRGVVPNSITCKPTMPAQHQDLSQAAALLKHAGYNSLTLNLSYQPNNADQTRIATLFQSNLAQIGVNVNLVPLLFPAWQAALTSASTIPQMMLVGDAAQYPDPGTVLTTWYLSSAIGSTNRTGFHSKKVDALITQATQTTDDKSRCALYSKAESLIAQSYPGVFMYTTWQPVVYHWNIKGVAFSSTVRPIDPTTMRLP